MFSPQEGENGQKMTSLYWLEMNAGYLARRVTKIGWNCLNAISCRRNQEMRDEDYTVTTCPFSLGSLKNFDISSFPPALWRELHARFIASIFKSIINILKGALQRICCLLFRFLFCLMSLRTGQGIAPFRKGTFWRSFASVWDIINCFKKKTKKRKLGYRPQLYFTTSSSFSSSSKHHQLNTRFRNEL